MPAVVRAVVDGPGKMALGPQGPEIPTKAVRGSASSKRGSAHDATVDAAILKFADTIGSGY